MKNGIDVSYHQGLIDWELAKKHISFAIIRAGYGQNCIDTMFKRNASECERLKIPYGVYWFSYAKTTAEAINEAKYCLAAIKDKNPSYPVIFDFEYASDNNAINSGYKLNDIDRYNIAKAFLDTVESAGYYAMLYTNKDYLSKGFASLIERYDIWLAQWTDNTEPYRRCGLWQWTDKGKVEGIHGNVDLDRTFKDYPAIIRKQNKEESTLLEKIKKIYQELGELIKGL